MLKSQLKSILVLSVTVYATFLGACSNSKNVSHITKEEWENVKKEYENPPYENPEVLKNRVERVSEVFAEFEFELFESVGLNDLLNFIHNGDSTLFEGETADLQTALISLGNDSKEKQKFIKILEKKDLGSLGLNKNEA